MRLYAESQHGESQWRRVVSAQSFSLCLLSFSDLYLPPGYCVRFGLGWASVALLGSVGFAGPAALGWTCLARWPAGPSGLWLDLVAPLVPLALLGQVACLPSILWSAPVAQATLVGPGVPGWPRRPWLAQAAPDGQGGCPSLSRPLFLRAL